jgi:hypothetical protein
MKYRGIIVEEGLADNRVLNKMNILKIHISPQENKTDRWHLFEVEIEGGEIEILSKEIIEGWYAHFWHGTDIIAVFKDKMFKFNYLDKKTWVNVLEYGNRLGIPNEQLDFPIFGL